MDNWKKIKKNKKFFILNKMLKWFEKNSITAAIIFSVSLKLLSRNKWQNIRKD